MIPLTNQAKTGGQQDQGHEVVLHDQGEGYQQPKFLKVGVAKPLYSKVFKLASKAHIL